MKQSETICAKHDEISRLAGKISSLTDDQAIDDIASDIITTVENAKEDGCRMEEALKERRATINELQKRVNELEKDLEEAEGARDYYRNQAEAAA